MNTLGAKCTRRRPAIGVMLVAALAACHGDDPVFIGREPLGPCESRGLIPDHQKLLAPGNASSPWLSPWRAWQDTWPASRVSQVAGFRSSIEDPASIEAYAPIVAAAGMTRYSFEVPWGAMDPDRPEALSAAGEARLRRQLAAVSNAGLRANVRVLSTPRHPAPAWPGSVVLTAGAAAGATAVQLDAASVARIVPGRTGLDLAGFTAGWLFKGVDAQGIAQLVRPLPAPLAAGAHAASTLRYPPFSRPLLPNGEPNPAFEEPLSGWLAFLRAVASTTRQALGSERFDITVWGSGWTADFLDVDLFPQPREDQIGGTGVEEAARALRQRSVQALRSGPGAITRAGIGDGLVDVTYQTPESGSTLVPGTTAIVRKVIIQPLALPERWEPGPFPTVDAFGNVDAVQRADGWWVPTFVPRQNVFFPELPLHAIMQSSFRPGQIYRDLSPIVTVGVEGERYGRDIRTPGAQPVGMWIGVLTMDPGDVPEMTPADRSRMESKAALRGLIAYAAKGAQAVFLKGAQDNLLLDPAREGGGPVMNAVGRLMTQFRAAPQEDGGPPLWLTSVTACNVGEQFAGDGTPAHPPLSNRDVVAAFPFRVDRHHVAIAAYVMTRSLLGQLGAPGPAGADLPAETYRLTFAGVNAARAQADAHDPLDDAPVDVRMVERHGDRVTIELPLRDWPVVVHLRDG